MAAYHTTLQDNPLPVELLAWKDAEVDYCRSLISVGGTREVPKRSIANYLQTQIASARRDLRPGVSAYLEQLLAYWRRHPRYLALPARDRN